MYAGTTFRVKSGRVMGVHQRVDRLARKKIKHLDIDNTRFPTIERIIHFEGKNGPDGIKSKSPSVDEPWHFVNPLDKNDRQLYKDIENHIENLTQALRSDECERAAFEAAWLSHAIVDGLTPPHQYPLSDKIEELWGKPKESRTTVLDKSFIKGVNSRDTLSRNWKYWGAGGVWTAHYLFEWGFAAAVSSSRFNEIGIDEALKKKVDEIGYLATYESIVNQVFALEMYEEYYKKGWTRHLAKLSREQLMPLLINAVGLAWYEADQRASTS